MTSTALELARVPFHGDTLEAVAADDKIWVSIIRVCDSLGIDGYTQSRKLKSYPWATTSKMTAVAEDGRRRGLTMIDLESLPIWLVTIHPSKVAFETRIKLATYQKEAKAVLAAWFLGDSRSLADLVRENAEIVDRMNTMSENLSEIRRQQFSLMSMLREETTRSRENSRKLDMLLGRTSDDDSDDDIFMTPHDFFKEHDVRSVVGFKIKGQRVKQIEKELAILSRRKNSPVRPAIGPRGGCARAYRFDVLRDWMVATELGNTIPFSDLRRMSQGRLF